MEIGKSRRPAAESWIPLPINSESVYATSAAVLVQSVRKYIVINRRSLASIQLSDESDRRQKLAKFIASEELIPPLKLTSATRCVALVKELSLGLI